MHVFIGLVSTSSRPIVSCIAGVYWIVYKCRDGLGVLSGAPGPKRGPAAAPQSGSSKEPHTAVDVSFILIILLIDDY